MFHNTVWTIAGSDSSGCAGIQADLKTFNSLGVHGCSVITAVTAQSQKRLGAIQFIDIAPQLDILLNDHPPQAIKIGMLGHTDVLQSLSHFLNRYTGKVILDPVLITTSGGHLFDEELQKYISLLKKIFKHIELLTPNIPEAEMLLQRRITSYAHIEQAAADILSLGVKSVLIKGGHFNQDSFSQDFWTNGTESFWLSSKRHVEKNFSGTGCTLSSAITAACALDYDIKDAIVIAKMYVNQAMRLSYQEKMLYHADWPENQIDLPYLSRQPLNELPQEFLNCGELGLYPIVDSAEWLNKLLPLGVSSIQLRIKDKTGQALENEISKAIKIAQQYQARLFINDYWELAIRLGAYGVHLGQEDLDKANISAIFKAGLHLGISTHNYFEAARAHAYSPSYIAYGPVFETQSKKMPCAPQGTTKLKRWRNTLSYPLVAIGGIDLEKLPEVLATGVENIAVLSAITQANDPVAVVKHFLERVN